MRRALLATLCLLPLLAGCLDSGATTVSGKVTLDDQPVDSGVIVFLPVGNDTAVKGGGPIENGRYVIPAEKKLAPGDYKVEVYWPKKTGRKVAEEPGSKEFLADETREAVPAKYNARSTLRVTLAAGANTEDFELRAK